jgi:glutamyl-tRNA synthetase
MTTQLTGPVRVRFPPSPTGFLHVGGARTAIYNELLRLSLGGSLVLRIEDTDQKRSDEAMTRQIVSALGWMGITCDEGPFLQSERVEEHRAAALRLLEEGKAYRCFHRQEEVEAKRKEMVSRGENYSYRVAFDEPTPEDEARRLEAGEPFAIRFRMPKHDLVFPDLVRKEVVFPAESLDDFIILRSDGSPTYHLSVVCDDIHHGVTHVLRGEDHISNTPKHIGLFQGLGAELPAFGHLPLILGSDKKRLSKRTGAASVEEFRDQGILPQALYNYLALLGWSPGDGREVMSKDEMVEAFTAERLGGSAAVFDYDKLAWFNAQYMSREPLEQILHHAKPFLEAHGLADADPERLHPVVDLYRQRAHNLAELAKFIEPLFRDTLDYDPALCQKFLKTDNLPALLEQLAERYGALDDFTIEATDQALRDLATESEVKAGALIHPTRMALTAAKAGPPLFDVVVVVGQEKAVEGLRRFAEFLRGLAEG